MEYLCTVPEVFKILTIQTSKTAIQTSTITIDSCPEWIDRKNIKNMLMAPN